MLIVANYHYIREDFSAKYPSIFGVTPAQFRAQLTELSKTGTFISQHQLLNMRDFKKDYYLITFDDGLREQFELAKPVLDAMGIPFIFFINTVNFKEKKLSLVHKIHLLRSEISSEEILNKLNTFSASRLNSEDKKLAIAHYNYDDPDTAILKYLLNFKMDFATQKNFIDPLFEEFCDEKKTAEKLYFTSEMLQQLHKNNSLASHSNSHVPLGKLKSKEVEEELKKSQEFFRKNFGAPAKSLSYPYGSFEACEGISEMVKDAGFEVAFTMERAANKSKKPDPFLLSRFDCNDLPLGKNDLFKGKNPFETAQTRNWYKNEDSFNNQR